jgi:glycosyltransferase involved in cell wall biosynthesis
MSHSVAVLMAAYNAEKTLLQAVNSLTGGTHPCKIYIVDDCSRVPVADVIGAHDPSQIEIIRLANNGGPGNARNAGIRRILESDHEFVAIMDADDVSYPERIEKQVAYLAAHPNIALVGCWERVIDENGAFVSYVALPCDPQEIRNNLFVKMFVSHPTWMLRTSVLREVGEYSLKYYAAEDYELLRRIAQRYDVANIPEYLIDYRISPGGMTASNRRRQLLDRLRIQLKYFEPFNRHAWIGVARTLALMAIPVKRKLPDTISQAQASALRGA